MSGGYGGRGADDGQGYGGQGYDEQDYDDQQGYGGRHRPRRRAGVQQPPDGPGAPGGRGRQPRGYPGQGGGPARGQGPGQEHDPPQGRDQEYGRRGGRPDPRVQGQRRPGGAPQYPRGPQQPMPGYGADPRGPRRGTDPGWQEQGGYDPRDAYPGGYQDRGDPRYGQGAPRGSGGQQGWGGDPGRDPGLLPGFGQGDDRYPGDAGGYPGYETVVPRPRRGGGRGRDDNRGGGGGDGYDDWDDDGGSGRRRSTIRRLAPWIALLVILTPLLVGGIYIYNIYENKYHPADYSGPGTGSVTVQVNSGDTAFSLGPKLQSLGVVASARAFELAAEQTTSTTGTTTTGTPPGLEAGFYKLHMHMKASLAWAALLNTKNRVQLTVTIPEGKRASQVALILAKATSIPASKFQAVLSNPAQLGLPSYANGKVEGYLFPATYTIQPNQTALQILQAMVQRYNVEAQAIKINSSAAAVHLTPARLIVVASLVQAEGGRVADYPKIAEVIYNRLARGMKLQFDSTVFYGLGKYGTAATNAEINTPGPYNTYQNTGLPPGPIDGPGDAAIQAALHPAHGDLLYFFSSQNGATQFSPNPISH